jgi:hypothetical protein
MVIATSSQLEHTNSDSCESLSNGKALEYPFSCAISRAVTPSFETSDLEAPLYTNANINGIEAFTKAAYISAVRPSCIVIV